MELGNIVFGNSRGEYPVEREVGFESELERLFHKIDPDFFRDVEYENDVFSIFPYYWGECTCGFDYHEFKEEHRDHCYQTEYKREQLKHGWIQKEYWLDRPPHLDYKQAEKLDDEIREKLCRRFRLEFPAGSGVHCTCDMDERYTQWLREIGYPDGCRDDCLLVKPNFHYKPTDYRLKWYKYPLRDSYANQDLDVKEFRQIIDHCLESLEEK